MLEAIKRNKDVQKMKDSIHNFLYYTRMSHDGTNYARTYQKETFPHLLTERSETMINEHTGFDIEYQRNKVFNLKLASKHLDHLVIYPNETFSFWMAIKDAQKEEPYKEGLCIVKGEMCFVAGGGLCQLSNLLFRLFLNGPFEIVERHGHQSKEFFDPNETTKGIDATVAEGYLDLKVKNTGDAPVMIVITFDEKDIHAKLLTPTKQEEQYTIINRHLSYTAYDDITYETVDIYRQKRKEGKVIEEVKLYTNKTKILYSLKEVL